MLRSAKCSDPSASAFAHRVGSPVASTTTSETRRAHRINAAPGTASTPIYLAIPCTN